MKITPIKIILNSADNMNNAQSEKYGLSSNSIKIYQFVSLAKD